MQSAQVTIDQTRVGFELTFDIWQVDVWQYGLTICVMVKSLSLTWQLEKSKYEYLASKVQHGVGKGNSKGEVLEKESPSCDLEKEKSKGVVLVV